MSHYRQKKCPRTSRLDSDDLTLFIEPMVEFDFTHLSLCQQGMLLDQALLASARTLSPVLIGKVKYTIHRDILG